jgi:hypothetical protein
MISAYDYNTKFKTVEYLTRQTLRHHSIGLVEALARHRQKHGRRPIVFVCHSVGELLVKSALIKARVTRAFESSNFSDIFDDTSAIVFLGTPHRGSAKGLVESLNDILGFAGVTLSEKDREELGERCVSLSYSLELFKPLAARLNIHTLTDEPLSSPHSSPLVGSGAWSQATETANNGNLARQPTFPRHTKKSLTGDRGHLRLCKFSNPQDRDLQSILDSLSEVCREAVAPPIGPEKGERVPDKSEAGEIGICEGLRDQLDVLGHEATGGPEQVKAVESYFGRWLGARARNIADEAELPGDDTSIWPIAILTGAGNEKTETVLRYIQRNEAQYGSVLWVNASHRKSVELSFRCIARRVLVKNPDLLGLQGFDADQEKDLDDEERDTIVQVVTDWLGLCRNQKWLLVVDGFSWESGYPPSTP